MNTRMIRVFCVDDHAFLIDGLQARLEQERDIELVGRQGSTKNLCAAVSSANADIVLMDIEIPGSDPFDAVVELKRAAPDVRTIMFSAYVRDHYIDAAYKAGAWGYLCKSDPPETVIEGLRSVRRGDLAFSPEVDRRTRDDKPGERLSRLSTLTRREAQVLRLIAKGMSRTEIAEELSRSPMTIDNHRKSIMKKLGINDRGELVRFAIAEGLVEV